MEILMFKRVFLLLLLPISLIAAHKYEYVDAPEAEDVYEHRPCVVLNTVYNKRNETSPEMYKPQIEVSSGKIRTGEKYFQYVPEERLKEVKTKEQVNIVLNELKDYFLKASADNTKILKLNYSLVGGKHLYIHLMRYIVGANVSRPEMKEIFINLSQLAASKKKEIESIQLTVIVDGEKMERSSVEAVPVFKEDNGASKATPGRPSGCTITQATARS